MFWTAPGQLAMLLTLVGAGDNDAWGVLTLSDALSPSSEASLWSGSGLVGWGGLLALRFTS